MITIAAARPQVNFSTTSVVLRTPMIAFEEEKLDARPPPYDSWISTMKIINNAIKTINTTNNVYIFKTSFIYYYFSLFLAVSDQFLQEAHLVAIVGTLARMLGMKTTDDVERTLIFALLDVDSRQGLRKDAAILCLIILLFLYLRLELWLVIGSRVYLRQLESSIIHEVINQ